MSTPDGPLPHGDAICPESAGPDTGLLDGGRPDGLAQEPGVDPEPSPPGTAGASEVPAAAVVQGEAPDDPQGSQSEGLPDDGAALLDLVRAALTRYVVLPSEHATVAVTLWIAATHAQPAWAHAPRLVIRGPEKRCGKSRLLDTVEAMVFRALLTTNASPAAVYRSISEDPPTLLVDEADAIFGPRSDGNEELRALLNSGHQANRPALRWDSKAGEVTAHRTFCMAALAGIGQLPDTIEDRAVIIRMHRRAPGDRVLPYRHGRDRPALARLGEALHEWLRSDLDVLESWVSDLPVEDRLADTWEPLVVVAERAGGAWPQLARAAVLGLTAEGVRAADQDSDRAQLLTDIRAAFGDEEAVSTSWLLDRLRADPEGPWCEAGLTARKLAVILREYGIHSINVRFPGGKQAKGFLRVMFLEAWDRYARPAEPAAESGSGPDTDPGAEPDPGPLRDADAVVDLDADPHRDGGPGPACPGPGPGGDGNGDGGGDGTGARPGGAPGAGAAAPDPSPPWSPPGRHTGPGRADPSHPDPGTPPAVPDGPAVPALTRDGTAPDPGTAPAPVRGSGAPPGRGPRRTGGRRGGLRSGAAGTGHPG